MNGVVTQDNASSDLRETFLKPQDVKAEYDYEVAHRARLLKDLGIAANDVITTAEECEEYEYEYEYVVDY